MRVIYRTDSDWSESVKNLCKLDPAVSLGSFHLPTGVPCFRLESNLGEERQREYLTPLAEKETK